MSKPDPKVPLKSHKKPRRGRPKQTDEGIKARGRLLDAAESLFAERGFYGVTTRQVADAAHVDVALIYYHFKNKSGLFDAVFARRSVRPQVSMNSRSPTFSIEETTLSPAFSQTRFSGG